MISDLFLSRSRTQLYGYDKVRVPFHAIRAAQLVSSIIVGSIMAFFIYHLQHDHWPTPWTFKVVRHGYTALERTQMLTHIDSL